MKTLALFALVAVASAAYKDSIARNKMFPAAAAAYNTNPSQCVANTFSGGKVQRRVQVVCDESKIDTCEGYSAYSTTEKILLLSFRGTNRNIQLVMEAEETVFKRDVQWVGGGNVSEYFNDGFMKIWNKGMKDDFTSLAAKYPSYSLYITGHSLGGALAALCASYIQSQNLFPAKQTYLYTFGEPRVGNKAFAEKLDKDVPTSYRVTHHKDIVPHLPMQYVEKFHHHEAEIWYQEDMSNGAKYTVCNFADESFRCSDRDLVELSTSDHVTYFNVSMDSFANGGCKYPTTLSSVLLR